MIEITQSRLDRAKPPISNKRENVKQALEYLAVALNPSATREEKFAINVAIDMLLDALEI